MLQIKGFSLLELLVILLIMGLLAGVTFPQIGKIQQSNIFNIEKKQLISVFESLPYFASLNALELEISTIPTGNKVLDDYLKIPTGWSIKVEQKIIVKANGFCAGGKFVAFKESRNVRMDLLSPMCKIQLIR